MDVLDKAALHELMAINQSHCVSMYMTTHPKRPVSDQDPIRYKNLLMEAETQLHGRGMRTPDARSLLTPAYELLAPENTIFWKYLSDGLAVFVSQDFFRHYRLPRQFEQQVMVFDSFHINPMLPLLMNNGKFYILALSKNSVRLLKGTRYTVNEVNLENVPKSLAEALQYDVFQKQWHQHHMQRGVAGGQKPTYFHGYGIGSDDLQNQSNIPRYFQQIDRGLHELLKDEKIPLVLAGVDYLLPVYREVNTYRHLIEDGITGNPEELRPEELHALAWPIVLPYFRQAEEDAVARYMALSDTSLVSTGVRDIVPASVNGRVDVLFVQSEVRLWGTYDAQENEVKIHKEYQPGAQDLFDLAVMQTLRHKGNVYSLKPEHMPMTSPIAAIFRYQL